MAEGQAPRLLVRDVLLPGGGRADVLLADRVLKVGAGLAAPPGTPQVNGKGLLALPGGVDLHVHFRTPGASHKETLLTGTRAAVKGGVTTCGDMPNTSPPTTGLARVREKLALAAGAPARLFTHLGAEANNLREVREAAAHPSVSALKIFMGPSTGHGGLAPAATEAHFRQCAELDLPVIVHAEDVELIQRSALAWPHVARYHGQLRNLEAELSAVRLALDLARRYPVRLCIAHTTSARVIELARRSGFRDRLFIEATPHHLLLSEERIVPPDDNRYKVNPPLRAEAERAALAGALARGIDGLGSDHAPHTLAEKAQPYDEAPSGIPGVEYQFALALTWWREGRFDLPRLIELTSAAVTRFFRLPGHEHAGRIEPGALGDLVLVDPGARWRIAQSGEATAQGEDRIASKCGWTLYAGMEMRGRIETTIVGGKIVWTRAGGWTDALHDTESAPAGGPGASDGCCD